MISISKTLKYKYFFIFAAICWIVCFSSTAKQAHAEGVTLSVTPTLIELSAEPDRSWESSIKVINNNSFELTVYATVVNFAPDGENGQGMFIPRPTEGDGTTIAEWLTVSEEPIVIPRESSVAVPVKLVVPKDASPGGHYAAIQIGTKPPAQSEGQSVRTSQVVTSLFFARVAGDVYEDGTIRSFRSERFIVGKPESSFELRFENKGNVHLKPQGEIVIKNMWGVVRGTIPINQQTHFGNVLPKSIRQFNFTWNGVFSLTDIGRYTAEVTLAYGSDSRHFASLATSFYVIPLKGLILALLFVLVSAYFIRFVIRSYVQRMLYLAGVDPMISRGVLVPASKLPGRDVRIMGRTRVAAPVQVGYHDLRARLASVSALRDKIHTISSFILSYRIFFICVLITGLLGILGVRYALIVTDNDVPYEVTIDHSGESVTLSSEQILYDANHEVTPPTVDITSDEAINPAQSYTLILTNASGRSGVAGALKTELETAGYTVDSLRSELLELKPKTVVIYDPALEKEALALSELLGKALLSSSNAPEIKNAINVLIGSERAGE